MGFESGLDGEAEDAMAEDLKRRRGRIDLVNSERFPPRRQNAVDFTAEDQSAIQQAKIADCPSLPLDEREAKLKTISAGFGLPAGAFEIQESGVWR